MTQTFYPRAFRARSTRLVGLLAVFGLALALAGCGSTAASKPGGQPSPTATQPLALAPAHQFRPRVKPGQRPASAPGTSGAATTPSVASTPCPAGEKRTATKLCYSPAAQTKLVARLGPCLAGQVVADNGACQPLTSRGPTNRPTLPVRCRGAKRAGCVPRGSLQGGGLKVARGPGFDTVFH